MPTLNILEYNQLDTTGLKRSYAKTIQALQEGDFKSASVKKMTGGEGLYRAKLDRENRLLFRFGQLQGKTYLLILEVVRNHAYEKSRFLNGATVQENRLVPLASPEKADQQDFQPLVYINPSRPTFHLLDKIISFDEEQRRIYELPSPLIIIGSAGSGKTALTLEKMKDFHGQVAYVSLSAYLVENAQRIYYANGYENDKQEIDFLSFEEFIRSIRIPKGKPLTFREFDRWYARYQQTFKFKEPYKIFEEFKGVLTGASVDKPYLTRAEYLDLGIKQSIFLSKEKARIYDLFEKFLQFLEEGQYYEPNIVAFEYQQLVEPKYDYIVVDEVQDITNVQLTLILRALMYPTQFVLSGDSNQIVHPNFFSWSKIKSLFFKKQLQGNAIRILKTNYRNARQVTKLSNDLLKIKNARFGSIDKESTYLIDTVSEYEGEVNFFRDTDKIKNDLNKKTQNSAKYAILVMNKAEKAVVRKYFKTPLLFTIQEAKGLEYENIILVNFLSTYEKEFREISAGISEEDLLDENMRFSRAKDKSNKELEAYKFYVNSLYVAFTRAVQNLYIIESNPKQDLLHLLSLVKTAEKLKLDTQQSKDEEWLEEARRLELQGKYEQAQEIRARLQGRTYVSAEEAEQLEEAIFIQKEYTSDQLKRLFTFAEARSKIDLIKRLHKEIGYGPAKQFMGEYDKAQKTFFVSCQNGNIKTIRRCCNKFSINMVDEKTGMSGLMIATLYNKQKLIQYFLDHEASKRQSDNINRIPLHMALLGFELEHFNEKRLVDLYIKTQLPSIKATSFRQMRKISIKSMEYFLVNYLLAVRDVIIDPEDPPKLQGLTMDDFMHYIELMPDTILPPYRKKRQYVNSILAKNEINRDDKYNRKLFVRKSRGVYNLYEKLKIDYE